MNKYKLAVIDFLQNLPTNVYEQYNEAFHWYRKHEGKEFTAERTYNQGFSESNLKNLLYDLQKVYEISDLELLDTPVVQLKEVSEETPEGTGEGNNEENKEANSESTEFTPAPTSNERTSLRDDFPFLKEKDCPLELKALVTDKINAYNDYDEAHNQLLKVTNGEATATEEELTALSKRAVEAFELNRDIYEELNYYKANGKVLGKHPIFRSLTLQREVNSMSQKELMSFRDSSPKFFSTKKSDAEKFKDDAVKLLKIAVSVEARTEKLKLVNQKLGVE